MDEQEILTSAMAILEQKVTSIVFSTFFKNQLKAHGKYGDTMLLTVSVPFALEQIKRRSDILLSAFQEASGEPALKVEVVLEKDAEARVGQLAVNLEGPDHVEEQLNPAYTFENYVAGKNNYLAYAIAVAVGDEPGKEYNPLFIHGGTGLGKTHLMQAIGHYAHVIHPNMNIRYISAENFTNQLVTAIGNHGAQAFRNSFRKLDLLMVDDIQFIAGKETTQTEFFHTFNELKQNNKQIVMVSDRPPHEIKNLEDRLCSRFEGGMVIDIQKPEFETRYAILQKKATNAHLDVDDDVLQMIAEHVDSNVREMEGCLTRVAAHARISGKRVTMSEAERLLSDVLRRHEHRAVSSELIQKTVSQYFNITVEDMVSSKRNREFNIPRQIAMYLCRDMLSQPFTVIGTEFKRHHSTVMNAVANIEKQIREQSSAVSMLTDIRRMVNGEE